ncbi:hypothetical protein IK146_02970 [Candidatus Saccharibacteria bacterium]|nr:hypothetical protein [Candidatus Saccharibacteria bacterium]
MHYMERTFSPQLTDTRTVCIDRCRVLLFIDDLPKVDNALLQKAIPVVSTSGRTFLMMPPDDADRETKKYQAGRFWLIPSDWMILKHINGECKILPTDSSDYVILDTREVTDKFLALKTHEEGEWVRVLNIDLECEVGTFNQEGLDRLTMRLITSATTDGQKLKKDEEDYIFGVPGLPRLERTADGGYRWKPEKEGDEVWVGLAVKKPGSPRGPRV